MQNPSHRRQIVPRYEGEAKSSSGVRERHLAAAVTVEMPQPVPTSTPTSVIRRVQVEHLGPLQGSTANDVNDTSFLINTGDVHATTYRFVAPRIGRRQGR